MSQSSMCKDLSRHLQEQTAELLARHLRTANPLLSRKEVATMLLQNAVSVVLTTAASCATAASPGDEARMFDATIDLIGNLARCGRERSLAAVAATLAGRKS
jgi:hypothetical protein